MGDDNTESSTKVQLNQITEHKCGCKVPAGKMSPG